MPTEGLVNFIYGTQASYDALETYNPNALYFLTDTNKLYKGDTLIANYVNERVIAAALVDLNKNINRLDSSLQDLGSVIIPAIQEPLNELKETVDSSLKDIYDSLNELDLVGAAAMTDLDSRIIDLSTNLNEIDDYISDTVEQALDEFDDEFVQINSSINTLEGMVETINSSIQGHNSSIVDLYNMVEDLSTNGVNSEIINDLSTNISELDQVLAGVANDLNDRINNVDLNIQSNQLLITEANSRVDDVESRLNWIVVNG